MQQLSKLIRASLTLVIALTVVGAVPASAHVSMDDSSSSGSSSTGETSTAQQAKQKAEQARQSAREAQKQANEAKSKAKQATQDAKAKTAEQRQKLCETHKDHVTAVFGKVSKGTNNTINRINSIYAKALEYQTVNNLSPEGIDALIATANTNKAAATDAVSALQGATPTINCSDGTKLHDELSTYRSSVQDTRTKLKDYRTSVKAVLKALNVPKPSDQGGSN